MADGEEQPAASPSARSGRHFRGSSPKGRHGGRYRHWPFRILLVANILVFVLIAGSATTVGYLVYEYRQIGQVSCDACRAATTPTTIVVIHGHKVREKVKETPPFTVLIIGSDSRADASKVGDGVGNTQTNSENLSDAIILARVSPDNHTLALLSIPRDLWVNIPGVGYSKINAAFSGGDPSRLVETIQKDLSIQVNHYASVNFLAVEEIANAIGGVEQYFPTPAKDPYSNLAVSQAGCDNLKGGQALAFVRSRHYYYYLDGEWQPQEDPESDLGRIQRQQAFIRDGVEKAERSGVLTNPLTLKNIISSVATNLTLDKTFSVSDLLSLADAFRHVNAAKIPSVTYSATNATVNGADVLLPSPVADAAEVKAFLATGTTTRSASTTTTTTRPVGTTSTSSTSLGGTTTSSPAPGETTTSSTSTTTSSTTTTTVPETTTTLNPDGNAYYSATAVVPQSSTYVNGIYIPPGRTPGQKIATCGN